MADVAATVGSEGSSLKKARGANPSVDYKALFQKSKDKYDRVSSNHTDIVANISRASAKQLKLRQELDWLLDTIATRRHKARIAAEEAHRRPRHLNESYYPQDAYPVDARMHESVAYERSYPPPVYHAGRYRSSSPPQHYPVQSVRPVQDPYADHVPPPPLQANEGYYRPSYASSRHIVDPYRRRSTSRSPPPPLPPPHRVYARSPDMDHTSVKRPRPPSTDPLDPRHDRWGPDPKRPRND